MRPRLIFIGAGGHARSLISILENSGRIEDVVGIWDNHPSKDELLMRLPVFDSIEFAISELSPTAFVNAIGLARGLEKRAQLFEIAERLNLRPETVVADSAIVAQGASIQEGVQIFHRVVVSRGAEIEAGAVLNTACIIEHDVKVGRNSFVAPAAVLLGGVRIGNEVLIGAGSIVNPGVSIGDGVTIGSGSLVNQDLSSPGVYVGSPARRIG